MITESRIKEELANVLESVDVQGLGEHITGKVRDSYILDGGRRLLVTSDRISAFDCVLGTIPFKGQVLNQLASWWFEKTKDIVPNHVIDVPDPNIMLVKECSQLPLEFVVRGYITGVTKTSAWTNYNNGARNICGNILPDGLKKNQKFDQPIITPTTKLEKHDRNISRAEAIDEGLIDGDTFDEAAEICLKLYSRASEIAAGRGLIFVDTKYELGTIDGVMVVSDEVNTPDSSRYWYSDSYEDLLAKGEDQRKLDKEYVRQWLAAQGYIGDGDAPVLSEEVRVEASRRYIMAYELITGRDFVPVEGCIRERVEAAIKKYA